MSVIILNDPDRNTMYWLDDSTPPEVIQLVKDRADLLTISPLNKNRALTGEEYRLKDLCYQVSTNYEWVDLLSVPHGNRIVGYTNLSSMSEGVRSFIDFLIDLNGERKQSYLKRFIRRITSWDYDEITTDQGKFKIVDVFCGKGYYYVPSFAYSSLSSLSSLSSFGLGRFVDYLKRITNGAAPQAQNTNFVFWDTQEQKEVRLPKFDNLANLLYFCPKTKKMIKSFDNVVYNLSSDGKSMKLYTKKSTKVLEIDFNFNNPSEIDWYFQEVFWTLSYFINNSNNTWVFGRMEFSDFPLFSYFPYSGAKAEFNPLRDDVDSVRFTIEGKNKTVPLVLSHSVVRDRKRFLALRASDNHDATPFSMSKIRIWGSDDQEKWLDLTQGPHVTVFKATKGVNLKSGAESKIKYQFYRFVDHVLEKIGEVESRTDIVNALISRGVCAKSKLVVRKVKSESDVCTVLLKSGQSLSTKFKDSEIDPESQLVIVTTFDGHFLVKQENYFTYPSPSTNPGPSFGLTKYVMRYISEDRLVDYDGNNDILPGDTRITLDGINFYKPNQLHGYLFDNKKQIVTVIILVRGLKEYVAKPYELKLDHPTNKLFYEKFLKVFRHRLLLPEQQPILVKSSRQNDESGIRVNFDSEFYPIATFMKIPNVERMTVVKSFDPWKSEVSENLRLVAAVFDFAQETIVFDNAKTILSESKRSWTTNSELVTKAKEFLDVAYKESLEYLEYFKIDGQTLELMKQRNGEPVFKFPISECVVKQFGDYSYFTISHQSTKVAISKHIQEKYVEVWNKTQNESEMIVSVLKMINPRNIEIDESSQVIRITSQDGKQFTLPYVVSVPRLQTVFPFPKTTISQYTLLTKSEFDSLMKD